MRLGMPAGLSSLLIQVQVPFTVVLAWAVPEGAPAGPAAARRRDRALSASPRWRSDGAGAPRAGPLLMVVGAALAWACANIIAKRIGRVDMLALMVWGSLATTPPLLALSLMSEGPRRPRSALSHPSWAAIASIAFQAYPTTLLAFGLWSRLLTRYPAATVTPFALLVPVAGILSTHLGPGRASEHRHPGGRQPHPGRDRPEPSRRPAAAAASAAVRDHGAVHGGVILGPMPACTGSTPRQTSRRSRRPADRGQSCRGGGTWRGRRGSNPRPPA